VLGELGRVPATRSQGLEDPIAELETAIKGRQVYAVGR
jgi:hypothetical protein